MSNFSFLKTKNKKLFEIIQDAENLFRDEYFEQSIIQTRRFAENLCRDLLKGKISQEDTFDFIINKLKDSSFENVRLQEFTEDLYFIKKHGNNSAHSSKTSNNGEIALECLERAFEAALLYTNIKFGYDKKLDELLFDEELLMTGKKSAKKETLKDRYVKQLEEERALPQKIYTVNKEQKPLKKKHVVTENTSPKPIKLAKISKLTSVHCNKKETNYFQIFKTIFVYLLLLIIFSISITFIVKILKVITAAV